MFKILSQYVKNKYRLFKNDQKNEIFEKIYDLKDKIDTTNFEEFVNVDNLKNQDECVKQCKIKYPLYNKRENKKDESNEEENMPKKAKKSKKFK